MEKKYFGGKLDKNIAFGLSWLPAIGWILAIVEFILDKDTLDVEEKRELVSVFVVTVAACILGVLAPLWFVLFVVKAIMSFMGKEFKVPGAYHLAAAIIK